MDTARKLVDTLIEQDALGHTAAVTQLLETHAAWIILTGEFAWKIKKPVNFGFLDYSTLEKRHFYCDEELRLNRRFAPQIYLDVVAITGSAECPRPGGDGPVLEYAVRMRQFPAGSLLSQLAEKGRLEVRYIDQLVERVAGFHHSTAVAPADAPYGEAERIHHWASENFQHIRPFLNAPGEIEQLERFRQWAENEHQRLGPLMLHRKQQGAIRECHGDLHLGNITLIDDQVTVFDCIEFNPDLRWIDVVSETAFLVMDLLQRQEPELAWRFLNVYLEVGGDYAGMELLPFYLAYRAMVRAKVAAIRASQAGIAAEDRIEAEKELGGYLQLAERCSHNRQPRLLITRGLSASGKSTLTSLLLEKLGAIRIRSDVERKRLFGMSRNDSAESAFGKGIYSSAASEKTYARLLQLAAVLLEAGFPVIVDAAFLQAEQRRPFQLLAATKQLPYIILELQVSKDTLRKRIQRRVKGVSDADLDVLERQFQLWKELETEEQGHCVCIDMEKEPELEQLLRRLRAVA